MFCKALLYKYLYSTIYCKADITANMNEKYINYMINSGYGCEFDKKGKLRRL